MDMDTKRARGKCIATALVCQLCWIFCSLCALTKNEQNTGLALFIVFLEVFDHVIELRIVMG